MLASTMSRSVRVMYHSPCADGAFAALAAYLRFKDDLSIDLRFVAHTTFNKLDIRNSGLFKKECDVFLLDYMGPRRFIEDLSSKVNRVILIDHHKSALEYVEEMKQKDAIPPNVEIMLKMENSGAMLAWEYFSKEATLEKDKAKETKLKELFAYIEDNDLWRKALPESEAFSAGIKAKEFEYDISKNIHLFEELQSLNPRELIALGKTKLEENNALIATEVERAFVVTLGGKREFGKCLAIETQIPHLRSDLGHKLAVKSNLLGYRGIGVVAYLDDLMTDRESIKLSLRSIDQEDTTAISNYFGGGGHKNASACVISKELFASWKE